tara:strand:+ start:315 stop:653 length:339 start_codon:yes stop_codon:yes gene_type:complete
MKFENIERDLENLLLRDIVIYNDKKTFKRGKFIIYKVKEFYYVLTLKNDKNELREYELPFPFVSEFKGDHVTFDYTLPKFYQRNSFVEFKTKVFKPSTKNKILNTTVVLSAV